MKNKTTEEFLEQAKSVHGDKYDYSETVYTNAKTKVKIKCKVHGDFYMKPNNHLHGEGCPICRYIKSSSKLRATLNEFIKKAKEVHGDKYDYSKVEYHNNRTKVCIVCPEHGEFWQTPEKHTVRKQGCPYCSGNAKKTTEQFIKESKEVHGDKYDYSKVEYQGTHKHVTIICKKHGEFSQIAKEHISGQGCPKCKQSKIEKEVFDMLKENNIVFQPQYKYDETNYKNSLDFFIPSLNIGVECQGEQHFSPVDFAKKGEEWANNLFLKNVVRDKYKSDVCKNKKIKLLYYIPLKKINNDFKTSKIFNGIYNNENVFLTLSELKNAII